LPLATHLLVFVLSSTLSSSSSFSSLKLSINSRPINSRPRPLTLLPSSPPAQELSIFNVASMIIPTCHGFHEFEAKLF
jgi:hypothetical protein